MCGGNIRGLIQKIAKSEGAHERLKALPGAGASIKLWGVRVTEALAEDRWTCRLQGRFAL
jgi:hypothetical protein